MLSKYWVERGMAVNSLLQMMYNRRSTRIFDTKPLAREIIESLETAALLAPAGRNKKTCTFLMVQDKALLQQLAKAKVHGSGMLASASAAMVVLGNEQETDVWIEDASVATTFVLLMAEACHIGACWVQIRHRYQDLEETISSEAFVQNVLQLPSHQRVLSLVALGYKAEEKPARTKESLDWNRLIDDQYT